VLRLTPSRRASAAALEADSVAVGGDELAAVEPAVARETPGAARRRRRRRSRALLLGGIDAVMLLLAVAASGFGASAAGLDSASWTWTLAYVPLTLGVIAARGGYRFRLEVSPLEHVGHVLTATTIALTLLITLRVLFVNDPLVAPEAVRLWVFAAVYLLAARVGRAIAEQRPNRPGAQTLIVGAGRIGELVARRLRERPELGLHPVGFLDKEPLRGDAGLADLGVLGASWQLEDVARTHHIEHVIVTFSTAPHEVLLDLVRRCRRLGLEVSIVPRLFEQVSNRLSVDHLGGIALLRVDQIDPKGWQFELKYAADRLVAALALVVLSPLLLAVAALVKRSSPGPVLFRQERVGLDGHVFELLKFRTMWSEEDAGEQDAAWAARELGFDGAEPLTVDRRTRIGALLRRWSIDELPQILNIARGDMSFIGPRPERVGYVRAFEQHVYRYGDRHRVKSGLTGWAQVQGLRGETSLTDRIEWDNYYVENWSPWLDLKILLLTLPTVLSGRSER
jgi:exopolysaccharide biosynthesis polyprenyl glycosylphosphotransferase